jgi:2-dehydropantoate 2-reductase
MVADVEQGKPTEAGELNGEIVRVAATCGRPAPINAALIELVEAIGRTAPPDYWTPAALRKRLGC